ncbi:ROK family protein [Oceanicella actignis]|uniref:ROK family protein n=1 Tax=Oceanicella actignis TaxID=1189325 RepID=UPI0011E65775|nr:ROK family protein [Oceanicella actignis]TYO89615.1 fructokinase [Oceanicella actignis]
MSGADDAPRLGLDFGGTKIEGVLMTPDGRELARMRAPTPRHDYAACLRAMADLAAALEARAGVRAPRAGVGAPGSLSPATGLARNGNAVWMLGRPLARDLAQALGRPVRVANDADCFALSEAADGAGAGARSVFGAILGTGVGAGIVIAGRALRGRNGVAGEWGHIPLPAPRADELDPPRCWCGRRGCIETWLSGPGLAADFARAVGAAEGEGPDAAEIAALAEAGDEDARAALDRWFDRAGRALALIVNVLDPEAVVLGGGLSNLPGIEARLSEATRPHVFSDVFETAIRRNMHGDGSGVRGAARLWDEEARDT